MLCTLCGKARQNTSDTRAISNEQEASRLCYRCHSIVAEIETITKDETENHGYRVEYRRDGPELIDRQGCTYHRHHVA